MLEKPDDSQEKTNTIEQIQHMDQGSDGACGVSALKYKYGLNISKHYDHENHGSHNDFGLGLDMVKKKPLWICHLIHASLHHGLNGPDSRVARRAHHHADGLDARRTSGAAVHHAPGEEDARVRRAGEGDGRVV